MTHKSRKIVIKARIVKGHEGKAPPIRKGVKTEVRISGEEFVRALADAHGLDAEES